MINKNKNKQSMHSQQIQKIKKIKGFEMLISKNQIFDQPNQTPGFGRSKNGLENTYCSESEENLKQYKI